MSIGSKTSESDQLQSAVDQLEAGALLAKLIKSSPEGGFSAKHLLTANPLLRAFPGCVVDLAYEQYCRDTDAGKNVTPTEFVKDFSNVQQSLYRILEFDQLLHEHPSLVEGVPAERWPKPGESFQEWSHLWAVDGWIVFRIRRCVLSASCRQFGLARFGVRTLLLPI